MLVVCLIPASVGAQGECQSYSEVLMWVPVEGSQFNFNLEETFVMEFEINVLRGEDVSNLGMRLFQWIDGEAVELGRHISDGDAAWAWIAPLELGPGRYSITVWPIDPGLMLIELRLIFVEAAPGYRSLTLQGTTGFYQGQQMEHGFDYIPGLTRAKILRGPADLSCRIHELGSGAVVTEFSGIERLWEFELPPSEWNEYYLECNSASDEPQEYRLRMTFYPERDQCDTFSPDLDDVLGN